MSINQIIEDRIIKAIYMGFIINRSANDFLSEKVNLGKEEILKYLDIFNKNTKLDFNKIKINYSGEERLEIRCRVAGSSLYLNPAKVSEIHNKINDLINENRVKAAKSGQYIDIFDLNTFDLLDRSTYNTMGDKYIASDSKRYMVHFLHLYSISDSY